MAKKNKKPIKKEGLSPKRERFCQEIVVDDNGTKAAERAKYSKNGAGQTAYNLLKIPEIRARIAELKKEIAERTGVTPQMIADEWARIGFVQSDEIFDYYDQVITVKTKLGKNKKITVTKAHLKRFEDMSDRARASIAEIRETNQGISIKTHSKDHALDSLARYHGMFTDKMEVSGPNGGPIETNFTVEFIKCKPKDK
jgi:phage terminase small subunit